jgi:phosphate starvation-inducible PhoH-like protein
MLITIRSVILSRRKNSAIRKEQEKFMKHPQKDTQTYYQKHENTIEFNPQRQRKSIHLIPKSVNQEDYILALTDDRVDVVVGTGPAGTGKTYLATLAAIQALRNKQCERIVLTRPAITVDDEKHGFLPGDLNQKMEPWTRPLLDVFREFYHVKEIEHMLAEQIIEISPLAFMRGRTFKNAYVILDEAQNATPSQFKMLLTRIGENSKIVLVGDTDQADRKRSDNGLLDLQHRLSMYPIPGLIVCKFDERDIQRHSIIEHVLLAYKTL